MEQKPTPAQARFIDQLYQAEARSAGRRDAAARRVHHNSWHLLRAQREKRATPTTVARQMQGAELARLAAELMRQQSSREVTFA